MKFIGKKIVKETIGYVYYHSFKKFKSRGNRALIYHAFGSTLPHDTYGISIQMKSFMNHIDYLYDNYEFSKISDNHSDKLTISITIDDGYKDTLDAIEYISRYQIPLSLYITTNMIGQKYLNKEDLRNISSLTYCEIGTHGQTHTRLGTLSYKNQENELKTSMKCLEDIVKKLIACLILTVLIIKKLLKLLKILDIKMPQLVIKALTLILRKNMSKRELKLFAMIP